MDSYTNKYCKFTSFNCKNFKSSIDDIRNLCKTSHLVCLQVTWLLNHDILLLGTISSNVEYVGKSAVDSSSGILRDRPYGGLAILWRKGIFNSVATIECRSTHLVAIKASMCGRSIIVFSVYMPIKSRDNLPIFTEVLSEISAIEESSDVENIFILGDFNAHPYELFYTELCDLCTDRSWICADVDILGTDSNVYPYMDMYHKSRSWLDHCVVSQSAQQTIVNVGIMEDVFVSDHLPIYFECDLGTVKPKLVTKERPQSAVIWGKRDESQINLCHKDLRDLDFPSEFSVCGFGSCKLAEHKIILDTLYDKIICILCDAAIQTKRRL